jgi:hypothetical protein
MIGGLWLLSDYQSDVFGQPFEGRGQTGYDPKKNKHVGTWVDTMSDHIILTEGTYDEASKTLTVFSDETDQATGKPARAKYVTEFKDDDTRVFTLSMKPADAKDYVKSMEISYKRRRK